MPWHPPRPRLPKPYQPSATLCNIGCTQYIRRPRKPGAHPGTTGLLSDPFLNRIPDCWSPPVPSHRPPLPWNRVACEVLSDPFPRSRTGLSNIATPPAPLSWSHTRWMCFIPLFLTPLTSRHRLRSAGYSGPYTQHLSNGVAAWYYSAYVCHHPPVLHFR